MCFFYVQTKAGDAAKKKWDLSELATCHSNTTGNLDVSSSDLIYLSSNEVLLRFCFEIAFSYVCQLTEHVPVEV
jgi:hypothetical protein